MYYCVVVYMYQSSTVVHCILLSVYCMCPLPHSERYVISLSQHCLPRDAEKINQCFAVFTVSPNLVVIALDSKGVMLNIPFIYTHQRTHHTHTNARTTNTHTPHTGH